MDGPNAAEYQALFEAGSRYLKEHADLVIEETIRICEVPAPPFHELERARYVAGLLADAGYRPFLDRVNNVVVLPETGNEEPLLLVAAHLDTVFPPETVVTVRRGDDRLYGPGIGDNAASLAIMVALAGFLKAQVFAPPHGLAFAATVGEEGLGDLRGMRCLYDHTLQPNRQRGCALILDGQLGKLCNRGVASRRLEIRYRGPGGHSWSDYGRPSAVHALGRAIAALDALPVPREPRSTLNVGLAEGGTAVNAIAAEARLVLDLRSEDHAMLAELEASARQAAIAAASTSADRLDLSIQVVGDRPGGFLPPTHPLVNAVLAAGRSVGRELQLVASSTDANIPLSRGIPALALGTSLGSGCHTLNEQLDTASLVPGATLALAALLACSRYLTALPPE